MFILFKWISLKSSDNESNNYFITTIRIKLAQIINTSRRSCHCSFQILIFLDLQSRFLSPFLLYKILVWKNRSWLSGKIHVDRILAGEARSSSPVKILVFLNDSFLLKFLSESCSWSSCLILMHEYDCLLSLPICFH